MQSDAAIQQIETDWQELMATVDGVPDEQLNTPGAAGEWSAKDVLGHVAFWDADAADRLERLADGRPQADDDGEDWQVTNEREATARAGKPASEVRAELDGAHARVLAALRRLDEVDPELIEGATWSHYRDHIGDLRAWRAGLSS
jgi:uncharacterized protein (TIGR03083 family)